MNLKIHTLGQPAKITNSDPVTTYFLKQVCKKSVGLRIYNYAFTLFKKHTMNIPSALDHQCEKAQSRRNN